MTKDKLQNKFQFIKFQKFKKILENHKAKAALLWIFEIVVVLVFAAVVAIFFFQSVTMKESSMEPTLSTGDQVFINRIAYKLAEPKRGELVIFATSEAEDAALHIKRVIGLPGETVQIKDGRILINGETYKEDKDFPAISNPGMAEDSVRLGAGEFFVLGDNRNNSEDSRHGDIGKVQKKYITGKPWFVFWPLGKLGFLRN